MRRIVTGIVFASALIAAAPSVAGADDQPPVQTSDSEDTTRGQPPGPATPDLVPCDPRSPDSCQRPEPPTPQPGERGFAPPIAEIPDAEELLTRSHRPERTPRSGPVIETFFCNGGFGLQSWVVPPGVTLATFDLYGAAGGTGTSNPHNDDSNPWNPIPGGAAGRGGRAISTLAVTPGETIWVNVGCQGFSAQGPTAGGGGFNGGGTGAPALAPGGFFRAGGGGGGGGSDIRRVSSELAQRVVVAGGGAGGGGALAGGPFGSDLSLYKGGDGGHGGHPSGTGGETVPERIRSDGCQGGAPGTQTGGGAGGQGCPPLSGDTSGGDGTLGSGGDGTPWCPCTSGGGGGGGGWYGGGAGASYHNIFGGGAGGGGGGSSAGPAGTIFETGVRAGHGLVTIGYTPA